MKTLLASCAVVALMAAPAFAQSTVDPQMPDVIPVEPEVAEPIDPTLIEPQTDVLPEELPADPTLAEETAPPVPEGEAVDRAETEAAVTTEFAGQPVALEAQVNEASLPDEYSTDDLNSAMLAEVNEVATEIASLDAEADVWVSEGSEAGTVYAPEGQGDIETLPEETLPEGEVFTVPEEDDAAATDQDAYLTPEAQAPETEMEPQFGTETEAAPMQD